MEKNAPTTLGRYVQLGEVNRKCYYELNKIQLTLTVIGVKNRHTTFPGNLHLGCVYANPNSTLNYITYIHCSALHFVRN